MKSKGNHFFPLWIKGTIFYGTILFNIYAFFFWNEDSGIIMGVSLVLFLFYFVGLIEGNHNGDIRSMNKKDTNDN